MTWVILPVADMVGFLVVLSGIESVLRRRGGGPGRTPGQGRRLYIFFTNGQGEAFGRRFWVRFAPARGECGFLLRGVAPCCAVGGGFTAEARRRGEELDSRLAGVAFFDGAGRW